MVTFLRDPGSGNPFGRRLVFELSGLSARITTSLSVFFVLALRVIALFAMHHGMPIAASLREQLLLSPSCDTARLSTVPGSPIWLEW